MLRGARNSLREVMVRTKHEDLGRRSSRWLVEDSHQIREVP